MLSVRIKNGTVVDGTGAPRRAADVLVDGDRIVAVDPALEAPAVRTIDATGRVVCPGFVDAHSHADLHIFRPDHPRVLEPLVRQGITTFVGGNCGVGLAPIDHEHNLADQLFYLDAVAARSLDGELTWRGVGEYLSLLETRGVALNVGLLCPHALLRLQAMGQRPAPAGEDELAQMARALRESLEEGALGMSVGLQYFPGLHSETAELVRLGAELKPFDGRFTAHMRSYTRNTELQALEEVATVARENEIHAQVSHLLAVPWRGKLNRPFMWGVKKLARHSRLANALVPDRFVGADMARVTEAFDGYRRAGVRLGADVMPTTTGFTHLFAFLPPWVIADGVEAITARLRDPATRAEIIRDIEGGQPLWPHRGRNDWSINFFRIFGYEAAVIMAVGSERNKRLEGMSLADIAAERGEHPAETAMDLLLEEDRRVLVFGAPGGEPEDAFTTRSQLPALAHPEVAVVTDTLVMGFGKPSYLFYGCYPRLFGYHVREKGLLGLEEAVRKCTLLPAESLGLRARGRIAPGAHADIVIFDPERIGMEVDFRQPDRRPGGIENVFINGKLVLDGDRYDATALAGQVLRRN